MRNTTLLSDEDLHRFARQLILSGFEEHHQSALLNSHVVVIGAGGLGAPLIQYLAAAGIGTLTIFDDDDVELTNLNRQVIHAHSNLGMPKTISAQETVHGIDPQLTVHLRTERFDRNTVIDDATLICDASDNPETRYTANEVAHCSRVPLVFGGAVRMEGQMAVLQSGADHQAPCYRCLFPKAPGRDLAPGCSEAGILGAITGVMGTMMALEAIRHCLIHHDAGNPLGPGLGTDLMLFDGRYMTFDRIKTHKDENCPTCGISA